MDRTRLFWILQIGGWTAYGISSYLAFLPDVEGSYATMAVLKVVRTVIGFVLSFVIWRVLRAVRERGVGLTGSVAAVLGSAAIFGPAWLWLYWTTTLPLRDPESFPLDWSMFPRTSLDHAFVFVVWGALYLGSNYWRDAEDERRRAAEARARAHEAELSMLRYQLNPHLLFNAMASLRASIPTEADEARRFVERISSFLRYALDSSDRSQVPLGEELSAARAYLAVERARWGEDLVVTIDAEDDVADVPVPGFLLHPLVENAVKHGIASGARPLEVEVRARSRDGEVVIEVANTVASWSQVEESEGRASPTAAGAPGGVGLENIRRRLDAAFEGRAELRLVRERSRARALLRLPAAVGRQEGDLSASSPAVRS